MNDIGNHLSSPIRLFADDCVIYRQITNHTDVSALQSDINQITRWCYQWQMEVNVSKTKYIQFTRTTNPELHSYMINNMVVENVSPIKYLKIVAKHRKATT